MYIYIGNCLDIPAYQWLKWLWSPGHLLLRGSACSPAHSRDFIWLCVSCFFPPYPYLLADILDQCTHGISIEQTNMAACALYMQMCPVSFRDGSELSFSSSLRQWTSQSACHTHTLTDCQRPIETTDTTETNMSVPRGWAAIILSRKLCLLCEGKKQQHLLIDSDSLRAEWYQMCFCIIT